MESEKKFGDAADSPTTKDLLGFMQFVRPLKERITNIDLKETPLTIGIYGAWGSGKTSFLNMLEKELKEKKCSIWIWVKQFIPLRKKPKDWADAGNSKRCTIKSVIENYLDKKKRLKNRPIYPIWFNAWKYSKEDNLWSALIQRILDEGWGTVLASVTV